MLNIPEEIKALFRADNRTSATHKKFKLTFYDTTIDTLYPYETLFPDESLFPSEGLEPWLVIENDRIVTESLQITEALSSDDDIVFGSCEGAELQITVADVTQDINGREFTLTVEIGGYEMALGLYTVKSFERQSDRRKRKITAYDRMDWFNTNVADWYNNLPFPLTLKAFRDSLCEYIGIQQSGNSLVLDSMEITKTIEPEQISGLDVLTAICEINGCFGHIDKTGQLVYVQLQQTGLYPSETLYPEETLYPSEFGGDGMPTETVSTYKQPMTYEDYLVEGIDSLVIRQEEGDVGANVGEGNNTYAIEGNFLVYGKSGQELLSIAQSLLPYISGRVYRPVSLDCNCMPWLEVGDAIIVPTKDDIVETFLMKRTISGCQAMRDKIESTGSQTREEQFTIQRQITQLEGKSAVIVRTVEEVSTTVTNLAEQTQAQLSVMSDRITAEVTRATEAEGQLSSRITQTAEQISLKVSKGDVTSELNSELTITGNSINLTTGHFTINSKNMTVDNQGNATFSGNITGANITGASFTGGSINIGNGNFTVSSGGIVNAKNAKIEGATINATGLMHANSLVVEDTFEGNIGSIEDFSTGHIWCSGNIDCNGIIYGTVAGTSDRRKKKDIVQISQESCYKIISAVSPVSYRLTDNNLPGIGFIAQDIENILKNIGMEKLPLFGYAEKNDMYYIPYLNYIAILAGAIQYLDNKVKNLEVKLENSNI